MKNLVVFIFAFGCNAASVQAPTPPPIPTGELKGDGPCQYTCADNHYAAGQCTGGWQCDSAGKCLTYVGTPSAPNACPPAAVSNVIDSDDVSHVHDGTYQPHGRGAPLFIEGNGSTIEFFNGDQFLDDWAISITTTGHKYPIETFYDESSCAGISATENSNGDWSPSCFGVSLGMNEEIYGSVTDCTLRFNAKMTAANLHCSTDGVPADDAKALSKVTGKMSFDPVTDELVPTIPSGDYSYRDVRVVGVFGSNTESGTAKIEMLSPTTSGCFDREANSPHSAHLVCVRAGHCYYRWDAPDANGNTVYVGAGTSQYHPQGATGQFITMFSLPPGQVPDQDPTRDPSQVWPEDVTPEQIFYQTPAGAPLICGLRCPAAPPPPPTQPSQGPYQPCDDACADPDWEPSFGFESPLILNFTSGATYKFLGKPVPFDVEANGTHALDWTTPDLPLLALDLNGDGIINDGRELFGTATVIAKTSQNASDGFAALAQYDENADGQIDANDAIFSKLVLWFDANSDGVCQPTELRSLISKGVMAIHLQAKQVAEPSSPTTAFVRSTSSIDDLSCAYGPLLIADVWFATAK